MAGRFLAAAMQPENRPKVILAGVLFIAITYFLLPTTSLSRSVAGYQIVPGATWTASGTYSHVQAHGPGIIKVKDTYYMIGEDKTGVKQKGHFKNVNCYSSTDLAEWKFENSPLTRDDSIPELGPNRIVERPKVLFNNRTNSYVMIMHIDNEVYSSAEIGFANSTTVCGKYTWQGHSRPLMHESRDIGVFQEEDGTAYLLSEDRPNGLHIFLLTWDYMHVGQIVHTFPQNIESPAMFKRDGIYYLFGSHLTGWNHNDNVYTTAPSLEGPWAPWKKFAPEGSHTFESQTSFVLPVSKDLVIYGGDRWVPKDLESSTYIWLPMTIKGTTVSMKSNDSWVIDKSTDTWSTAPPPRWFEAEHARLENGAKVIPCVTCSGGQAVGNINGAEHGAILFDNLSFASAGKKTFLIEYWFKGTGERQAQLRFHRNGHPEPLTKIVSFLPVAMKPGVSVLNVDIPDGVHSLSVEGVEGTAAPDIDRISVPN